MQTPNAQDLGELKEIVFHPDIGIFGVVDTDEQGLTPIPWSQVVAVTQNAIVMDITKQDLQQAPTFQEGQWSRFNNPQFTQQIESHFRQSSMGGSSQMSRQGQQYGQAQQRQQQQRSQYQTGQRSQQQRSQYQTGQGADYSDWEMETDQDREYQRQRQSWEQPDQQRLQQRQQRSQYRSETEMDTEWDTDYNIQQRARQEQQRQQPQWQSRQQSSQYQSQSGQSPQQVLFVAQPLIGRTVQTQSQQELGELKEIVFHPEVGIFGLIETDNDRLVPVPWSLVGTVTEDKITMRVDQQTFRSAPSVQEGQLTQFNSPRFTQSIKSHFNVQSSMGGSSSFEQQSPGSQSYRTQSYQGGASDLESRSNQDTNSTSSWRQ